MNNTRDVDVVVTVRKFESQKVDRVERFVVESAAADPLDAATDALEQLMKGEAAIAALEVTDAG